MLLQTLKVCLKCFLCSELCVFIFSEKNIFVMTHIWWSGWRCFATIPVMHLLFTLPFKHAYPLTTLLPLSFDLSSPERTVSPNGFACICRRIRFVTLYHYFMTRLPKIVFSKCAFYVCSCKHFQYQYSYPIMVHHVKGNGNSLADSLIYAISVPLVYLDILL